MTGWNWKNQVIRPTQDLVTEKTVARIHFLESDLRKRGYYTKQGIELEFFILNKTGGGVDYPEFLLSDILKSKLPLFERIEKEFSSGKYEIVFGTPDTTPSGGFSPGSEVARNVEIAKTILPDLCRALESEISEVNFTAARRKRLTAGMHVNSSVWNQDTNKNQFYYDFDKTNDLIKCTISHLLQLQKEGVLLYAPQPESFMRYGRHDNAPQAFYASYIKGHASVSPRSNLAHTADSSILPQINPSSCRIEDRLAGADANPYFPILAGLGSIWLSLQPDNAVLPAKIGDYLCVDDYYVEKFPQIAKLLPENRLQSTQHKTNARLRFERSTLWRQITGDDLFEDLVAYFKPRTLDEVKRGTSL